MPSTLFGVGRLTPDDRQNRGPSGALRPLRGLRCLTPFPSEESAHLARLLGDEEGCERHFREAHRLYTEMGAVGHAERVGRELEASAT